MAGEFPSGLAVTGSGSVPIATQVTAVAPVKSQAWGLLHAVGVAKNY